MKRLVSCIASAMMLFGLFTLNRPAVAQDIGGPETETTVTNTMGSGKVGFAASFDGSQQFNTDIDHGGSFSLFRGRFGVAVPVRFNESWGLDTRFGYQWDSYNFSDGRNTRFGNTTFDPWGTINTLSLVSLLKWQMSEKWAFYGGGIARFSVDGSTSLNDGFTAGGIVGFNYAVNTNLTLGAGLVYMGQIENDSTVIPIVTANWQINDKLRLKLGYLDVATTGYGAELTYAIAPRWQLGAGAQYHRARFKLNRDASSVSSSPGGVGQESAGQFYARLNFDVNQNITLSGYAGLVAGGALRLENSARRKLFDNNYDTTGMAGAEVNVHF